MPKKYEYNKPNKQNLVIPFWWSIYNFEKTNCISFYFVALFFKRKEKLVPLWPSSTPNPLRHSNNVITCFVLTRDFLKIYRVPQKKCLIAKFDFWVPIETVCSLVTFLGAMGCTVGSQKSFLWYKANPGILYKCTKYHSKEQTISIGTQKSNFAIRHFFWGTLYLLKSQLILHQKAVSVCIFI